MHYQALALATLGVGCACALLARYIVIVQLEVEKTRAARWLFWALFAFSSGYMFMLAHRWYTGGLFR